jgi:polar amino acid transport system substrate-binding protein
MRALISTFALCLTLVATACAPAAPTAAPVAPTAAPVAPTAAPVAPTAAPVAPTAAPAAPIAAPAAPAAPTTAAVVAAPASGTLATIKQRGSVNVFMEARFEPYEYLDESGTLVGLDVDLARKMFQDDMPGVTVNFSDVEYPGLLPSLITGKSDFLISALGSTKERLQQFDFSIPYSPTTTVAVARADNDALATVDDLDGKVIGAQTGTPTLTNAQRFDDSLKAKGKAGFKELRDYPHYPEELQDLTVKRLDAVSISLSAISLIIKNQPGQYKVVGPVGPVNYFGVVTRKDDTALVEYINSELRKFKTDGTLAGLHQKWFGDSFPIDVSSLPDPWVPLT